MAETESQAPQTKRHEHRLNDDFQGEEEEEEEDELEEEAGVSRLTESHGTGAVPSSDAGFKESQLETLANDDCSEGLQLNPKELNLRRKLTQSTWKFPPLWLSRVLKHQHKISFNHLFLQLLWHNYHQLLLHKTPDGYNWRKYGQKQVKSPKGSRSYYKCTFSDCQAKKIECSDHTGHVVEIVNKGTHGHEPPRKNNSARERKNVSSTALVSHKIVTAQPIRMLNDSDPSTSSKESVPETTVIPERKRSCSSGSDGNVDVQVKEELTSEPEPRKRQAFLMKKSNVVCSDSVLKTWKKPRFVVHAAGDVGISGDGYRWRKYGQKMVKGNPNPRNYYRCTSAGCPVRKHIETAEDNTNAVIITYKGVHDHDMPVPKKRHGQPSAPLVAAAAPASMNNLQLIKTDRGQSQVTPTQWSVGTEGELTGEALDLGGEKAIESARTLLSIGFEIKPC